MTARFLKKACLKFTKAYINSIIGKEEVAAHLLSKHNIRYLLRLMGKVRQAVIDGRLSQFVLGYLVTYYESKDKFPDWVIEALKLAEISD